MASDPTPTAPDAGLDAAPGSADERAARRPTLAAADGHWSFGQWLCSQHDALFDWCIHHTGRRVDPDDFIAMAMAVQRDDGARAQAEWLLWAALMLARQDAALARRPAPVLEPLPNPQPQPGPAADPDPDPAWSRLHPRLQRLLWLAHAGQLTSAEVMALLECPLPAVDARLAAAPRHAARDLGGHAA